MFYIIYQFTSQIKPNPFKQEFYHLIFLHSRREKLLVNRISAGRRFSDHTFKTFKWLEAKRRMLIKHRHGIGRINYVSKNNLSLLDYQMLTDKRDATNTTWSNQNKPLHKNVTPFRPSLNKVILIFVSLETTSLFWTSRLWENSTEGGRLWREMTAWSCKTQNSCDSSRNLRTPTI